MFRSFSRTALIVVGVEIVVGIAAAFILSWSGIYNVAATAVHGPFVTWFLHYTMRQSVRTQAASIQVPPLDDPVLVRRGAAHYYTGCAPCHGAPGTLPSAIEENAEPPPPFYPDLAGWRPNEQFWIVRHGIKMTAMPPLPTQARDDEIWAMVAFLRQLPGLDPTVYHRLALGESKPPAAPAGPTGLPMLERPIGGVIATCARCHGFDGRGRGEASPRLAGLGARYIDRALREFRQGRRKSGFMQPIVAGLTDEEIGQLAAYYAQQEAPAQKPPPATVAAQNGADIARFGNLSGAVPPCLVCHDLETARRDPDIPGLAHQPRRYLAEQLALFSTGRRNHTPYARVMSRIAEALTPDETRDVAIYFGSLNAQ